MHNDLMFYNFLFAFSFLITIVCGQQTIIYIKRGETVELCDNRSTIIFAYEYRSFDSKINLIIEPSKDSRYSNPYGTSLLRINNVNDDDSGLYKCPQDDIEWQRLQVYVPIQNIYFNNYQTNSRIYHNDFYGIDTKNFLMMVDGEPLDVVCAADGSPRPALDISLDKNGTTPTIMALASGSQPSTLVNNQFKSTVYETYRIVGLTSIDNGRNVTCSVDMKQIDKNLVLSVTKQLYIEFRPTVLEKSKRIYSGINQTRTINCTVLRANPTYIRYTVNGLSPSIIHRTVNEQNNLQYTFDITPTSLNDFGLFNVTANNSVGFDTCTYELIHGGVPDAITNCSVDTQTSNTTITINCLKSYAQGDSDGYTCTLFKYNDKNNQKIFEEIARTKSCLFALQNFHEPVEFRIAAMNKYGSLPINTHSYIIRLNQPIPKKDTPLISRKILIIIGSVFGCGLLFFFLCCLCGTCHQDRSKYNNKTTLYHKDKYPRSSTESEALKPNTDDTLSQMILNGGDRHHQNGAVYDIPTHLNGKYSHSITSPNSVYHQQKPHQTANVHYIDQDSITSSLNSIPTRTRTFNNKFYGNPLLDQNKYGTILSARKSNHDTDEIIENDEEADDSPVYSTTTDVMSESGSFLVPSSSSMKRRAPPPPKPRYSTLSSVRLPMENLDKHPLPLPKPRSRSNSRTRLNNTGSDNSSVLYEERPASSSDSGIGQLDVVCLPNGDTIRSGLVKSRQNSLKKQCANPLFSQQQSKYETLPSTIIRGTEC